MYRRILLPTDGGPGTTAAINRAIALARRFNATVHVLYVAEVAVRASKTTDDSQADLREHLHEHGHSATIEVQNRAADLDVDVTRSIVDGVPHRAIREYITDNDIDLVVMGTRGRVGSTQRYLGSTTHRVLGSTEVPVLTVGIDETDTAAETELSIDRLVITTDGSETAERAADHGITLAAQYDAAVRVIYVVDTETYSHEDIPGSIVGLLKQGGQTAVESISEMCREETIPVSTAVLRGQPETAILQYTTGADAELIAMGARGAGGASTSQLGSTTARVVQQSKIPVLSVQ